MADRILAAPQSPSRERLVALDELRGFVILLVVLHHAVLAYCRFGHIDTAHYALSTAPIVDARRWAGFDVMVALNDGFFMPLLFLLSGVFVWDGLGRKGPSRFLHQRLLRLGLPFAVAELTVVPLAYYPSFLHAGGAPGFVEFWIATVTTGPWPSGPPWFLGVLLLFDAAAALAFALRRRTVPVPIAWGPVRCFVVLLMGSVLLYVPLLIAFGPTRWVSFGPVAVQISRVLLYAAYFATGVALGARGMDGARQFLQAVARRWAGWAVLAMLSATIFLLARPPTGLGWSRLGIAGLALATHCAAACFALLALFMRFAGHPGRLRASLARAGFAIYLLHYPAVTWMQHALLPSPAPAVVKAAATFAVALVTSWMAAEVLRHLPGVGRAI